MKIAFLSDIHSNIEALTAVMRKTDELKPDQIIELGDVIGYGPNPNEALDIVKSRADIVLNGNHEAACLGLLKLEELNKKAQRAIMWTIAHLRKENYRYISSHDFTQNVNGFTIVHASMRDFYKTYLLEQDDFLYDIDLLKKTDANLCFFGHTHIPVIASKKDGIVHLTPEKEFTLDKGRHYMINPGSVGQPRDKDVRASFLIFDTEKYSVQNYRVEYDIKATMKKILAADLPEELAYRLEYGV